MNTIERSGIFRNLSREERKELARLLEDLRTEFFWIELYIGSATRRFKKAATLIARAHRRELRRPRQ